MLDFIRSLETSNRGDKINYTELIDVIVYS